MLPVAEARVWCRRQIRSLVGMTTDADNWGDFADLTFRALATCLRATDYRTARTILSRHRRRLRKLLQDPASYPIQWGIVALEKTVVRRRLAAWFQMRHSECIAASIRLELLASLTETKAVLDQLGSTVRIFRGSLPRASEVRAAALLFARCDLRTADRESDRRRAHVDDGAAARTKTRRGLSAAFRRSRLTSNVASDVSEFAEVCEALNDPIYGALSGPHLVLMTRPPTSFDVQFSTLKPGVRRPGRSE